MTHVRNNRAEYTVALFQSSRRRPHLRAPMSVDTWVLRVCRDYEIMEQFGSTRYCNMHREVSFDPWYVANIRSLPPLDFRFGNDKYLKYSMDVAGFELGECSFYRVMMPGVHTEALLLSVESNFALKGLRFPFVTPWWYL